MSEERCSHDMVRDYCSLCRPRPPGVRTHGFRTKGGRAFHNDQNCSQLIRGQREAHRRGMQTHPIEPIVWDNLSPGSVEPCEACCRPRRHR